MQLLRTFAKSIILILIMAGQAFGVQAVPGINGFGSDTAGGRGGTLYKVTTLADSGAGSFREAVTASGPRIVVFEVSGYIALDSPISITNPYLTIAGQTSTGGIAIIGDTVTINAPDVVVTHMRFRAGTRNIDYEKDSEGNILYYDQWNQYPTEPGSCLGNSTATPPTFVKPTNNPGGMACPCALSTGADPGNVHGLQIAGDRWGKDTYNIVIVNCSISGGIDETAAFAGNVGSGTFAYNIVEGGINFAGHSQCRHSKGLMIAQYPQSPVTSEISVHHNLIIGGDDRVMMISTEPGSPDLTVDYRYNYVHEWYGGNVNIIRGGGAKVNIVNNIAKIGTNGRTWNRVSTFFAYGWPEAPNIYCLNNLSPTRTSHSDPQWNIGDGYDEVDAPTTWQALAPWRAPELPDEGPVSESLANTHLSMAGATVPSRDPYDAKLVQDYHDGSGVIKLTPDIYPDDYPPFSTPAPLADIDNDGIADSWEMANCGGNLVNCSINGHFLHAEYDDIEIFIHDLGGYEKASLPQAGGILPLYIPIIKENLGSGLEE